MRTAEYALEEKKLAKEQAQYEAPTIKRQAEIDYEKAQRALEQSKRNLDTKTKQAVAKMSSRRRRPRPPAEQSQDVQDVMAGFTIKAPSPGMVIYVREWNGKKKGVGSQWNAWDPTVATLPDLTQMESQTYVNEVDVRKLAVGQKVQISLDADPTKKLAGTVTAIANVGEQRPNQDSKVFEVKIEIAKADTTLRPGMTTSNAIEIASMPNVLSIPLEAVTTRRRLLVRLQEGRPRRREADDRDGRDERQRDRRAARGWRRTITCSSRRRRTRRTIKTDDHPGPEADRRRRRPAADTAKGVTLPGEAGAEAPRRRRRRARPLRRPQRRLLKPKG